MPPAEDPISSSVQTNPPSLPRELCVELWSRVIERLEGREVFTTNQHFRSAIEEEYQELTGVEASTETKTYIRRMVEAVNTLHPETYLAQGVKNGVAQAFEEGVRRLKWDVAKVQASGHRAVQRFSRQDTVRDLLDKTNVRLDKSALLECVSHAVEALGRQHTTPSATTADVQPDTAQATEAARKEAVRAQAAAARAQAAANRPSPTCSGPRTGNHRPPERAGQ